MQVAAAIRAAAKRNRLREPANRIAGFFYGISRRTSLLQIRETFFVGEEFEQEGTEITE
jgi:hypothetical protein